MDLERKTTNGFARMRLMLALGLVATLSMAVLGLGCSSDDDPAGPTTGTVSGRVTEPRSGSPVVGAAVTISPAAKRADSAVTDASGDFTIADVEPGNYTLVVDASAVVVDTGDPSLEYASFSRQITVRAGENTATDVAALVVDTDDESNVLDGSATTLNVLDGLIIEIDADAVTFPGGGTEGTLNAVELQFDTGPAPLGAGFATSFMFQIVPTGVTFDPPARVIQVPSRDGLATGQAAELFSYNGSAWVSSGGLTQNGSLQGDTGTDLDESSTHFVTCMPHTVIGRVLDSTETPVSGAAVQILAEVFPFADDILPLVSLSGMTATTGADGTFSVAGVRACRVSFSASLDTPGGFGVVEPVDVQVAGDTTTDLGNGFMELVTQTTFTVAGTVRDVDGTPVVGAFVNWFDPSFQPRKGEEIRTDDFGRYSFGLTSDPGRTLGVFVFDSETNATGEAEFTVPALTAQGSTVTVDVTICDQDAIDPCGMCGTWTLSGSTFSVTLTQSECGVPITETEDITIVSLQNGVLTIEVEDEGEFNTLVLTRIQGDGPTGITSNNLPGLYAFTDEGEDQFVAIYANGTICVYGGFADVAGTYVDNGTSVAATFNGSTEDISYTRTGNSLSILPPGSEQPEVYDECPNGTDLGGIQNAWSEVESDATLVFYAGEFFRITYGQLNKGSFRTSR